MIQLLAIRNDKTQTASIYSLETEADHQKYKEIFEKALKEDWEEAFMTSPGKKLTLFWLSFMQILVTLDRLMPPSFISEPKVSYRGPLSTNYRGRECRD